MFYGDYHGWSDQVKIGGASPFNYSMNTTMIAKTWYTWNLTVSYDSVNMTVTRKDTGAMVWNRTNIAIDPIEDPISIWFGSFGNEGHHIAGFWDRYRVYANGYYPNELPVWGNLPTFSAVEDVPLTVDFTPYVSDPDGNVMDLGIMAISPYVTNIDGLRLTFKFPDGVTSATIPLNLTDGEDLVGINVEFIIEPVFYPPEHNIPASHSAVEDIQYTYWANFIWDIDTETEDLVFLIDDPYVAVVGHTISALFPEGVLYHEVEMTLSDGMFFVPVDLRFTITPVNDPPDNNVPENHTVQEDTPYSFYAASFIWDVDNAIDDLTLQVDDPYVTIDGHTVSALFPEGILYHEVELTLDDGELAVPVSLKFTITPVNDPPSIDPFSLFDVVEEQVSVLDITSYLHDIDTPLWGLVVTVGSPNCTVVGHELHFYYDMGSITETMLVQVRDSEYSVEQTLTIYVNERNDAPVVSALPTQVFIEDKEGPVDLTFFVEDEETPSNELRIFCDSPYVARIENMTITFLFSNQRPEHWIYFNVSDGELFTEGVLKAQVEFVYEPPTDDWSTDVPAPVFGVILLIAIAAIASIEVSKVALISLFLPLYSKLRKEKLLDQFTRGKIVGYILANPGEHYNSIKKTLDISNGSFVYHLNLLEAEGFIKSHRDGIYKRYYPANMRIIEQTNTLNKSQSLIMEVVGENPGISQKDIAAFLGISPSTINYHVEKLIQMGLMEKERKGMSVRYYLISDQARWQEVPIASQ
jgi:predicted transcriptional regulator